MVKRTLTGAVYVAVTVGAALLGQWVTILVFLPVCVMAAREWARLRVADGSAGGDAIPAMLLAAAAYLGVSLSAMLPGLQLVHVAMAVFALLVFMVFGMLRKGPADPMGAFGFQLSTVIYIATPFALATRFLANGPHLFLGFMFMLWMNDTGAYLVGRAIGRNKLMPAVSPGKTWEGLLGGVALTMVLGGILSVCWHELSPTQWLIGAAAIAITATIGDLLESAFKRARGVKDSGSVLPGHGGILDRFDGFLLAAPAMWLVVRLLEVRS